MVKRVVPLVVLTLAVASCGAEKRFSTARPIASVPTATPSLPPLPPLPEYSPLMPEGTTPACVSPKGWTNDDVKKWAVDLIQTDAPNKITFTSDNYFAPRLCQPVTVQVEFWRVDFTTFVHTTYDMTSVLRKRVSVDGKKTVTVNAPKGFTRNTCRGTILVAYAGKPLSSGELPESLRADGYSGRLESLTNSFWNSDRVFYTFRSMPQISTRPSPGARETGCEREITAVPG
jgi:hypothetical protein